MIPPPFLLFSCLEVGFWDDNDGTDTYHNSFISELSLAEEVLVLDDIALGIGDAPMGDVALFA